MQNEQGFVQVRRRGFRQRKGLSLKRGETCQGVAMIGDGDRELVNRMPLRMVYRGMDAWRAFWECADAAGKGL